MKGSVPARSVVIPGSYTKSLLLENLSALCFDHWYCKPSTDLKTSLNNALREYDVFKRQINYHEYLKQKKEFFNKTGLGITVEI
jgi:hypothetical protein